MILDLREARLRRLALRLQQHDEIGARRDIEAARFHLSKLRGLDLVALECGVIQPAASGRVGVNHGRNHTKGHRARSQR
jgi:hypothetical protein